MRLRSSWQAYLLLFVAVAWAPGQLLINHLTQPQPLTINTTPLEYLYYSIPRDILAQARYIERLSYISANLHASTPRPVPAELQTWLSQLYNQLPDIEQIIRATCWYDPTIPSTYRYHERLWFDRHKERRSG